MESRLEVHLNLSSSDNEMKSKSHQGPTVSSLFKKLVDEYEISKPQNINIIQVSKQYGIQHRRVYDFFNFLTYLGVCQGLERRRICWIGLKNAQETLKKLYAEIECSSFTESFSNLFSVGPSPSLGNIATKFVCLYFYLGVDVLSMRNVSVLFHHPRTDIKSLERRMYLVLSFLEIIGIVSHTSKRSEYKLIMKKDDFIPNAFFQRKMFSSKKNDLTIDCLLNNINENYIRQINNDRRGEFSTILSI